MRVLVKLDGLAQGFFALGLEQPDLGRATAAVTALHGLDDGVRVNALVDVQRHRGHLKRRVLGFSRPLQLRVEVWVEGVRLHRARVRICVRRHQPYGRNVDALLIPMLVGFDRALGVGLLHLFSHLVLPVGVSSRLGG